MGKNYLIDTNVAIDYLDNKLSEKANEFLDNIEISFSK
jgi:predicted nucleic acid-binding protein